MTERAGRWRELLQLSGIIKGKLKRIQKNLTVMFPLIKLTIKMRKEPITVHNLPGKMSKLDEVGVNSCGHLGSVLPSSSHTSPSFCIRHPNSYRFVIFKLRYAELWCIC